MTKIQVTTDNLLILLAVLVVLRVSAYIAVRDVLTPRRRVDCAVHRAMAASGLWTARLDCDPRHAALSALCGAAEPSPNHAGRTGGA